jgi:hypothetical protein
MKPGISARPLMNGGGAYPLENEPSEGVEQQCAGEASPVVGTRARGRTAR